MKNITNQKLIVKVSDTFEVPIDKIQIKTTEDSVTAICVFLDVEISKDFTKSIFVKMGKQDFSDEEICKEVKFYQTIKKKDFQLSVPNCHLAEFDDQTGQSILVLDDYSDSHKLLTEWPIPPKIEDCKKVISALAELHAKFWNHPKLGVDFGSLPDKNEMESNTVEAIDCLNEFIAFLGDRIDQKTIEIYKKAIYNYYPLVSERICKKKDITLSHQDAHIWNFLVSKKNDSSVYIIDWGSWEIGIGVDDLAYMIGLHWHPTRRKQFELDLLKFYHSRLQANGVENYSFKTCYEDYRIAILGNHFIPQWQWKNDIPAEYWWPHFERAPLSYMDLNCDNLIT